MITGRELIEREYSEVEYDEKLYSTGDSELDELLERAFCDGYEYAQREFSKGDDLAKEIKKAREEGDEEKAEKLKKQYLKRSRRIGAAIGAGAVTARTLQVLPGVLKKDKEILDGLGLSDKKTRRGITIAGNALGYGIAAGAGSGIGAAIGHGAGKGSLDRKLRKLKEEEENEKNK